MKYWGTSALPLLGIESSCEEIAAAVLADESAVPSSVVALQLETRGRCVVIVAELASRQHLRAIIPVARLIEVCRNPIYRNSGLQQNGLHDHSEGGIAARS
jgi:tRNA threonylcarbamoyladenosine modification (KEOPS) complex  Pcc1 subunit